MKFTEMEWRSEPMIGLYVVGKIDLDRIIEKIGNLREGESARFGFGREVIIENGNCVHQMQIRANAPDRVEVFEAGFSPFKMRKFFKSLPKLRAWLVKWEKVSP